MPIRFRKSIKLAPGVNVNFNKKSTSVTFGGKGVHRTISSTGKKTTSIGIPGTGVYYTETQKIGKSQQNKIPVSNNVGNGATPPPPRPKKKHRVLKALIIILAALTAIAIFAPDIEVEGIKLDQVNASMDINSEQVTECAVSPDGATTDNLEIITSDANVLTASENGDSITISSHNAGKAYIYLKSDNNTKSNKIKITVIDKEKQQQEAEKKKEQALRESREKAAEEASRAAEQQTQQETEEDQVYVSQTGSKYHSNPSCSNMNNPGQVALSQAEQMGLTPCKKCY